jgi:phosphoglycolate phosphatase
MHFIKGMLFDKDGTILNVDRLWGPVGKDLAASSAKDFGLTDVHERALREAIGVNGGRVVPDSVLASGTAKEIAAKIYDILADFGVKTDLEKLDSKVRDSIKRSISEHVDLIEPLGDLNRDFARLRDMGITLGIATADMKDTTMFCLRSLGVEKYFSFIGAEESTRRFKPDPELFLKFCSASGLEPRQVVMVGDSQVDIEMGRAGGAALTIAVDQGESARATADYSISSIDDLFGRGGEPIWADAIGKTAEVSIEH